MDDLIKQANTGQVTLYGWRAGGGVRIGIGKPDALRLGDPLPLDAPPPIPTPIRDGAKMMDIDGETILFLGYDQNHDAHYYRGVIVQRHQAVNETRRSGTAGRPSSMDLVLERFKLTRSELEKSPSRLEAGCILSAWLKETHPSEPQLTAKTIRDRLPPDFRPNAKLPKS